MPPLPTSMRWTPPPEGREEEQIEFSWAGETARHVGTVVHRWPQRIAKELQDELPRRRRCRIVSQPGAQRYKAQLASYASLLKDSRRTPTSRYFAACAIHDPDSTFYGRHPRRRT
jgi:hypothetical protein